MRSFINTWSIPNQTRTAADDLPLRKLRSDLRRSCEGPDIDQCIATFGLNGVTLSADKAVVLTTRDQADKHQASGACLTMSNDGVLAAVVT